MRIFSFTLFKRLKLKVAKGKIEKWNGLRNKKIKVILSSRTVVICFITRELYQGPVNIPVNCPVNINDLA